MELLAAIDTRASALKLTEPGPGGADLETILHAGVCAPDHGKLSPWRFVVLEGAARSILAEAMAEAARHKDPAVSETMLDNERAKPFRAPTIVAVAARISPSPKVPEIEQVMTVAAGVQNMILVAHSLGYGTMWKTGGAAYDETVKAALGLEPADHLVALLYLGTTASPGTPRQIDLAPLVRKL